MKKIALITGITGQDGSYLAELLLEKNYIVHGIKRRTSIINTKRIDHIYEENLQKKKNFFLHYGDMTDGLSLLRIINQIKPDEIYNLAAQSHVAVSFEEPEYTANSDALGTLRLLEIIRNCTFKKKIKFYQAGTSELYGKTFKSPQDEKTPFYPRSPYGVAKLYAHWITINYREAFNIFASNGILFNHESPRRGETFVTKKIVNALCKIKRGSREPLILGNLYAKRDWGHAKDYVYAMWKILQQKKPDDFVIATGKQYSIKSFVNLVAKYLDIKLMWRGSGINERAYDQKKRCIISCSRKYFRPTEVDSLLGNPKKAVKILKWKPKYNINLLVKEMITEEFKTLKK
jgi:GDPmannose 4,6-dehydratase